MIYTPRRCACVRVCVRACMRAAHGDLHRLIELYDIYTSPLWMRACARARLISVPMEICTASFSSASVPSSRHELPANQFKIELNLKRFKLVPSRAAAPIPPRPPTVPVTSPFPIGGAAGARLPYISTRMTPVITRVMAVHNTIIIIIIMNNNFHGIVSCLKSEVAQAVRMPMILTALA